MKNTEANVHQKKINNYTLTMNRIHNIVKRKIWVGQNM